MKLQGDLLGACGIYCGACKLCAVKSCKGCSGEEHRCPYIKCVDTKALGSCGQYQEFPCEKHYDPMAVYAEAYLDWRKQEIAHTVT